MKIDLDDPQLTAFALDELVEPEKSEVAAAVSTSAEAQDLVRELRLLSGNLRAEYAAEREAHLVVHPNIVPLQQADKPWSLSRRLALAAGIAVCACLGLVAIGTLQQDRKYYVAGKAKLPNGPT